VKISFWDLRRVILWRAIRLITLMMETVSTSNTQKAVMFRNKVVGTDVWDLEFGTPCDHTLLKTERMGSFIT
jgi:hypothetical protein